MSDTKDKTINNQHDVGYTSILGNKRAFVDFIKKFVREQWAENIDERNVTRDKKTYITQDFKEKEVDLVYRLKLKDKEVFFYILLELQSTVDYKMPLRLLHYMIEIWRNYMEEEGYKKNRKKDFSLPAIVPMVIYNGKNNWTAKRSFKELQDGFELFGKHILDFEYLLFDVNRYKKEELLKVANVMAAVFYIEQYSKENDLHKKIIETEPIITNIDERQIKLLFRWIKKVVILKLPKKLQGEVEKILSEKVITKKEAKEVMSNIATQIEEMQINARFEGREEGIIEGRMEGKVQGIVEGKVQGKMQGKMEGKMEAIKTVALNALKKGLDINVVSMITGLEKTDIELLKSEINGK